MKTRSNLLRRFLSAAFLAIAATSAFAADIVVYSDNDFVGNSAQLKRSEGYLGIGTARSVRIATGVWEACTGANFTGTCVRLSPGDYREIGGRYGVGYASFREVSSYAPNTIAGALSAPPAVVGGTLQLFSRGNYRGASLSVDQEIPDLNAEQYAVTVGSARVSGGTAWELCSEPYFRGRCQVLTPGDHADFGRLMRERVMSARPVYQRPPAPVVESAPIRGGYGAPRIELYTGPRFSGANRAYSVEAPNLSQSDSMFNDSVTSIRVTSGEWELCQHPGYTGSCLVFGVGEHAFLPPQLQRQITSIRPIAQPVQQNGTIDFFEQLFGGVRYTGTLDARVFSAGAPSTRHPIWIFEGREFTGRSLRTRNDIPDLRQYSFNDVAGSVFVTHGTWELCQDLNYTGRCYTAGPGQHFELPFGRNGVTSLRRVR
jgi:Beta/Gamma crystallin